jgi:hypothetical protein
MHADWRIETLVVDACALLERGDDAALAELAQLEPSLRALADDCRDAEAADAARAVVTEIRRLCAEREHSAPHLLAS